MDEGLLVMTTSCFETIRFIPPLITTEQARGAARHPGRACRLTDARARAHVQNISDALRMFEAAMRRVLG
jgi:hypothetical protein